MLSLRSVGGKAKRSNNNHSNLNEPIIEEEEEEKEPGKKIISETIQKRRKATMHIESKLMKPNITRHKSILIQNDPIQEEVEIDDDELFSENNFYVSWEKHKKYLLTQDEQAKINDDAHSSTGIFQRKEPLI